MEITPADDSVILLQDLEIVFGVWKVTIQSKTTWVKFTQARIYIAAQLLHLQKNGSSPVLKLKMRKLLGKGK